MRPMWPESSAATKGNSLYRVRRALARVGSVVAILVVIMGGNPVAYAQSGSRPQSYTSELTGWQVDVAGPNFALSDAVQEQYPHGRGERITINGVNSHSYAEVAFFDDTDTPEDTIAVTLREFQTTSQSFAVLDSGINSGVSYTLATFRLSENVTGYFYMEVKPDVIGNIDFSQSLFALNLDFPEQLSLASRQITVNGKSFLGDPVIDVANSITEYHLANPAATPTRSSFDFETFDSTIDVDPPVSLDYSSNANGFESVNVSGGNSFGIIGYLNQRAGEPADVLATIVASAPRGDEAPEMVHSEETREQVFAVYRIHREGGVTILVIQVTAVGPDMWRVEAVAGPEDEITTDLDTFQQSIAVDAEPFMESTSGEALTDILNDNQP